MIDDNRQLVLSLINEGWLKTPTIIKAFANIKREDFVPNDKKDIAYLNTALSIGFGQTISQPLVVAFMLELLQPNKREKILDIGCGSGWTSALLAYIVSGGKKKSKVKNQQSKIQGKVIAIDIIPELVEFAKQNVRKYNFVQKGIVQFLCADGKLGYEKDAPYDKILVSASSFDIPSTLLEQLKINGRLVIPIKDSIVLTEKISHNKIKTIEFPGFVFVPLV